MTTALVETKSLEDRVREKVHASIGELITEADLKVITERGIEEFFFKPRRVRELKGQMSKAIETWIKENPENIQAALDAAIRRGIADAVTRTMDERFAGIFSAGVASMQSQGLLPRFP